MKGETRFTGEIKKSLLQTHEHIVVQKHADRYTAGIADMEVVYNGMTTWLELKDWQSKLPIRNIHIQLVGQASYQLSRLQEKFLIDRINSGIRGFGVFRLTSKLAAAIPGNILNDIFTTDDLERYYIHKIEGIWQLQEIIK